MEIGKQVYWGVPPLKGKRMKAALDCDAALTKTSANPIESFEVATATQNFPK